MKVEPQKQHLWLQQLVGEWTYEHDAEMEPGKFQKFTGTEVVRSMGDIWVLCEARGEIPGGSPNQMMWTFGYDPEKKAFVGTFVGSMMEYLWVYHDGSLDAEQKVLTLHTEGPDFSAPGKMTSFKDILEIKSEHERVLRSEMLGQDGQWTEIMRQFYRRTK
ncbi:DUF1579 domain-containing protein [Polyangium sorediatum]|uniref:DUF1579 domain-containing protein n=1 Tax=Polyangium sorediatum TaxID=889274 RepID=A0ABT6PAE2_9BACT|nr:DUF1579 domain-containing protein [Polyangium sorediatum]MDI1437484.1 DUF1579 domain-containing protein [Polyangium sorediatum]